MLSFTSIESPEMHGPKTQATDLAVHTSHKNIVLSHPLDTKRFGLFSMNLTENILLV